MRSHRPWIIVGISALLGLMVVGLLASKQSFTKGSRKLWLVLFHRADGCDLWPALRDVWARHNFGRVSSKFLLEARDGQWERWKTPLGSFWIPAGERSGLAATVDEQLHQIYGGAGHGVRAGDIVLDCGASYGVYTRCALNAGASKVVAIEISPRALECLRRNFDREISEGRVILWGKGVWDREEELVLWEDTGYSMRDSLVSQVRRKAGPKVELAPIDLAVQVLGLPRVDFIKMDIEGAEQRALKGAGETLRRWRPRLAISAYHLDSDLEAIPRIVRSFVPEYRMGYGLCKEANSGRRIVPEVLFFTP